MAAFRNQEQNHRQTAGLKEKLLAAKRAGISKVLVPIDNRKDISEISKEITKGLEIVFVKTMDEVINEAFV